MTHVVLTDDPGKKMLLLGNVAIARGALEAGVKFTSTFPGTPASEIGMTFHEIAKDAGIYFEFSTNEKVAFEAAAGAAFSGLRSMVSFKQFGLNVASDSIFPVAYVGVKGGLVVVFADDPNGWSSAQSEQDSRPYAKMSHMPMLEPTNSQECIDFVKFAFDLSEKFEIPVFIRLTTRVSHTRMVVELGELVKEERKAIFEKDHDRYYNLPPKIIKMHQAIRNKLDRIKEVSESSHLNYVTNEGADSKIGVITSGVSFNYVIDSMEGLGIKLPVLKLGITYPLPENKIKEFIKRFKKVVIVEELESFLEDEIKAMAKDVNPRLKIYGKVNEIVFPSVGEYTVDIVEQALAKITRKKVKFNSTAHMEKYDKMDIIRRLPVFCAGCPHRATFYTVKKVAGDDAVYGGDIGCYIMGIFPPFETADFNFSMGASLGITHGIRKAGQMTGAKQKIISFIGDGTFFHAGISPLINMVFNKSNVLVVILDNRITAMTGHQPNPDTGYTGMGEPTQEVSIEEVVKACGVKNVKVVDPFNMKEMESIVEEYLNKDELSVIISKRRCYLLESRDKRREGIDVTKFEVKDSLSPEQIDTLKRYACPAFFKDHKGQMHIDPTICAGCASCSQIIEPGKIGPKKKGSDG